MISLCQNVRFLWRSAVGSVLFAVGSVWVSLSRKSERPSAVRLRVAHSLVSVFRNEAKTLEELRRVKSADQISESKDSPRSQSNERQMQPWRSYLFGQAPTAGWSSSTWTAPSDGWLRGLQLSLSQEGAAADWAILAVFLVQPPSSLLDVALAMISVSGPAGQNESVYIPQNWKLARGAPLVVSLAYNVAVPIAGCVIQFDPTI